MLRGIFLGVLRPVLIEDTPVGGYMQYACPGGNVTDNSRYVMVPCELGNSTTGGSYVFPKTWPACRTPFTCLARFFPAPPTSNLKFLSLL
jgi:hypothetical protein